MPDTIDLRPIVRHIETIGDNLGRQISQVSLEVGTVRQDVQTTGQELALLRAQFEEYVRHAELTANVQRSETKLSGLKDDLERSYGHYKVVRRTSIGLLQAFDIGNVSNATASQISEELMIQTPRYWLAPALVALAAWSKDDPQLAETSIAESIRRDARKTTLFFALVLRRQNRLDGAVRWLRQYLLGTDPLRLGREFAVVSEAAARGAFGPKGTSLLEEQLDAWNTTLRDDDAISEAQIDRWQQHLAVHRQRLDGEEFPTLRALTPEWPRILDLLEHASAVPAALEHFTTVRDRTVTRSGVVEDVLDELLQQLVTEYDTEELPLRREIAFHSAVVEEGGDLDRARAHADLASEALEETNDAVSLQTMMAIEPELLGVSVGTQQIAIGTNRSDLLRAIARYTRDYRSRLISAATITLDQTHSAYAATFGFPGWTASTAQPEAESIADLRGVWERRIQEYIEQQKVTASRFVVPALIAAVVTIIAFFINPIAGVISLLGGAGIVYFLVSRARTQAQRKIDELIAAKDEAVEASVQRYRAAMAEFTDAGLLYEDLDGQEPALAHLIETWPMGAVAQKETAA